MSMLFRFCVYGFLKNQLYFSPFLILAFRDKGLSFFLIGLLIGFRELCINVLEIPSGAVADTLGRRGAMVLAFSAYIPAFILLASTETAPMLFLAMFLFAMGEVFRTGTHKAIIFAWLARENREEEKTYVYGYTRSWSQLGSTVSVIAAGAILFLTKDYAVLFWACIPAYLINIVNFATYPSYVDSHQQYGRKLHDVLRTLRHSLTSVWQKQSLRRLVIDAMLYDGTYKSTKDYLQPVLKNAALGLAPLMALQSEERIAVAVALVYGGLYLLSSFASRYADSFAKSTFGARNPTGVLWGITCMLFVLMGGGIVSDLPFLAVVAFMGLAIVQNFWRPILVGRCADKATSATTATVLSVESQARSLFAAALAPVVGGLVDFATHLNPDLRFLPVALVGIGISLIAILVPPPKQMQSEF